MQAVHHGFGVTLTLDTLLSTKGKAFQKALSQVLDVPSFKVRLQLRMLHAYIHCCHFHICCYFCLALIRYS